MKHPAYYVEVQNSSFQAPGRVQLGQFFCLVRAAGLSETLSYYYSDSILMANSYPVKYLSTPGYKQTTNDLQLIISTH